MIRFVLSLFRLIKNKKMKKALLSVSLFLGITSIGQVVSDQVSVQQDYTHQSYYSFENGEVANIINNDWDMAFDVSAFGSAIRINAQDQVKLYVASTDTSDWMGLDTAGMSGWTALNNSDQTWTHGAFNDDYDVNNSSDLGWGLYNSTTHFITGNKLFAIQLSDGSVKKIWIKLLASGTYTFTVADLDNNNTFTETIVKGDYSGKNFAYYDIASQTALDREPASADWDIVFTKYVGELFPGTYYGVTGALANYGVHVHQAETALGADIPFSNTYQFDTEINVIGYDWKTFDFTQGFVLEDSVAYFANTDADGTTWKIVFTGFDGSTTGNIAFDIEQVAFAGIAENTEIALSVYPNPTTDFVNIKTNEALKSVSLISVGGKTILQKPVTEANQTTVSLESLNQGIYFLRIEAANGAITTKQIIKQ